MQQPRKGAYAPAGLRMPGPTPARDDFQDTDMRSPSMSTASFEQSPRTPAVAFRHGTVMSSQNTAKEPEEYYLPYASLDYQQHRQPAPYDPYFHQAQPALPVRAYAPPPQNYGYEPGQYYAPANPAAYPAMQEYYDYAQWQQPAPAGYYTPTGAHYTQHPRGQGAPYPYNTTYSQNQLQQPEFQQTFAVRAPPNALQQQPAESNALQLETSASSQPARPAQIPHADGDASDSSEPDGEFEYVFDCPDCGTSFLSLRALHAHLFIQYRRGWCPGVP